MTTCVKFIISTFLTYFVSIGVTASEKSVCMTNRQTDGQNRQTEIQKVPGKRVIAKKCSRDPIDSKNEFCIAIIAESLRIYSTKPPTSL